MYFNQYLKNNTFTTHNTQIILIVHVGHVRQSNHQNKLFNRATYRDASHLKIKTNRLTASRNGRRLTMNIKYIFPFFPPVSNLN